MQKILTFWQSCDPIMQTLLAGMVGACLSLSIILLLLTKAERIHEKRLLVREAKERHNLRHPEILYSPAGRRYINDDKGVALHNELYPGDPVTGTDGDDHGFN